MVDDLRNTTVSSATVEPKAPARELVDPLLSWVGALHFMPWMIPSRSIISDFPVN